MSPAPPTFADAGGDPAAPDLLDTPAAGPAAVRGGALRTGAYAAGLLLGVGSLALLFRHLGVVDSGRYTVAMSLVTIVAALSDLGLTAVGVREFSVRSGTARARLARNLLGLRIVVSVLGGVLIVAFAAGVGYPGTLVGGVALAAVGLLLQSCQSTLTIPLISQLRLGLVAGFDLVRAALMAALIVVLVLADAGLLAFLAVSIPVGLVVLGLNAAAVRGMLPLRPAFHPPEWRELLRAVLPYSAAVATATLYFQLAVLIVSVVVSAHQLGYFGVSSRTIQVLVALPGLAVGAALPIFARAARDDRARLAYALGRVFEVSLLLGVWLSMCLAIGSSVVIDLIGGSKFGPAASLLAIQGIGLGASFAGAVWANGLLSLGRYRSILMVNLLGLAIGGALITALALSDGVHGAAIGTAIGELLLAGLNGIALRGVDPSLSPPLRIVPAVASATGLAVATTLIDLPPLASVALASVVYFVVVLALRAVPVELLRHLPRLGAVGA